MEDKVLESMLQIRDELNVMQIKANHKVGFKDLSGWVKVAVVAGWVNAGYFVAAFIVGLIEGLVG